jgi:hypothetical protein
MRRSSAPTAAIPLARDLELATVAFSAGAARQVTAVDANGRTLGTTTVEPNRAVARIRPFPAPAGPLRDSAVRLPRPCAAR